MENCNQSILICEQSSIPHFQRKKAITQKLQFLNVCKMISQWGRRDFPALVAAHHLLHVAGPPLSLQHILGGKKVCWLQLLLEATPPEPRLLLDLCPRGCVLRLEGHRRSRGSSVSRMSGCSGNLLCVSKAL